MSWIKIEEALPGERDYCWIYDREGDVYDGQFYSNCPDFAANVFPLRRAPGFEIDSEMSVFIMVEEVSHWMPYFTPEPPLQKDLGDRKKEKQNELD